MKLTATLIILNMLVFALSLTNFDYFIGNFGFSAKGLLSGKYYIILTSLFLHADLLHLSGNMIGLLFLGWAIEKKIKSWQYIVVYFASGIIGNLSMFIPIFGYTLDTIGVGASAAISGLVGLGIFMCPGKFVIFGSILPMPFVAAGAVYLLFTLSNLFTSELVAHSAHLFGFLSGAIFGFKWSKDRIKNLLIFIALLLLIMFLPTLLAFVL